MATKAHIEGNKRYHETLDEIKVRVPKGKKEALQDIATTQGDSLNGYVKKSLKTQIKADTGQDIEL